MAILDHVQPVIASRIPSASAFNAVEEKINHFRSQLRRALLVVDDPDLTGKLRELETIAGKTDSYAQLIRDDASVVQKTFDVNALDRYLGELSKTTRSLSDATVARLKASG